MADVAEKPTETLPKEEKSELKEEENSEKSNGTNLKREAAPAAEEPPSEIKKSADKNVESSIIRQVEYYFGDANLLRDKFLSDQINKNEEGWVPLSVLMTFKRLAALSTDADEIVDALLKSEEGLVEISEDRTQIRRHPERPLPEHNEERRKEIMSRTAYAKGFPKHWQMSDLLAFFASFEKVANISMRKYFDRSDKSYKFKGSVFVTFEKKELTQDFIENKELKFDGFTLERKWQEDYLQEKREELKSKKEKQASKKKPKPDEKQINLPTGTVLQFEGVTDDTRREGIREAVEKIDADMKIAYIEFNQGEKEGKIRFQNEGDAAKFLAKVENNKLKVKDDVELTLRALSTEEETEFLKKVVESMKTRRNPRKFDRGGNRKRRFGNFNNHKGNKKHKFGNDDGGDDE